MWLVFSLGSALFAGLTSILAKCGIKKTDSSVATAVRTIVVLIFSWLMVLIAAPNAVYNKISAETWIFLVLSGLATGASWLCYFRALSMGDVNKVVPVDKSSTVLTIILAIILFHEGITLFTVPAVILIGVGTLLMIEKKDVKDAADGEKKKSWLIYAVLSAVFAALTSILGKLGISGINSNLGTAIRTGVVLVMAWVMVFVSGKSGKIKEIPKRELIFIILSGIATGGSWLCYYKAMQDGPASVVAPVDKLSILVSIAFSRIVFGEKLAKKAAVGLALIVAGTLMLLIKQ